MAEVRLTLEEYEALRSLIRSERESEGATLAASEPKKRSAAAKRSDKKLSRCFKEANARCRCKNGKLKKGKTQADVARLAQRLRKKM